MIKYIVTWCIINMIPCPSENKPNKYGVFIPNTYLTYCAQKEYECGKVEIFTNRTEAFDFYDDAKKEYQYIDSVKIDSVKTFHK